MPRSIYYGITLSTADEDAKDIFGLAVTIATTSKNKKEAEAFLRYIGVPLREEK